MPETNLLTKPEHKRALDRRDLDEMTCDCGRPDCTGQRMSLPCHPLLPAYVVYQKETGTLTIQCPICRAWGPDIAVATEAPTDA